MRGLPQVSRHCRCSSSRGPASTSAAWSQNPVL
jgi:hypothetical protein